MLDQVAAVIRHLCVRSVRDDSVRGSTSADSVPATVTNGGCGDTRT